LAQYLPILGFLIVVTLSSLQIEGFLINLNRFKARLYLDAGTELVSGPAEEMLALLEQNSERMRAMRQASPFAGL